jgi:hypothetical protein
MRQKLLDPQHLLVGRDALIALQRVKERSQRLREPKGGEEPVHRAVIEPVPQVGVPEPGIGSRTKIACSVVALKENCCRITPLARARSRMESFSVEMISGSVQPASPGSKRTCRSWRCGIRRKDRPIVRSALLPVDAAPRPVAVVSAVVGTHPGYAHS